MTSISYISGIPAANHSPAQDQPNMLTNTNNIPTYVSVDHVPFNTGSGNTSGRHAQVTFDSNNIPSLPTPLSAAGNNVGVLFTNTVGSGTVDQLFYYAGSAAQSSNQYVSNGNGSVLLLGGIIMKWGTATLAGNNFNQPVTFPVAFPNTCFTAIAIATNTGSNAVTVNVDTSFSASGFVAIKSSSSAVLQITYIAIGN
jgi:hypothetical protein